MMTRAPSDAQFEPPALSKREASILRAALIRYAKACDAEIRDTMSPQGAMIAANEAEIARSLAARIVKREQAADRSFQAPALRPIR